MRRLLYLFAVPVVLYVVNFSLLPRSGVISGDTASEEEQASRFIEMATFTKEILSPGNGPTPQPKQMVTVSADLYLADASGGKGTGIWSTHKPSGFLFSASSGPQPFEYQAGVGSVVAGWEDGVASMQLNEHARLYIPWKYACGSWRAHAWMCEALRS